MTKVSRQPLNPEYPQSYLDDLWSIVTLLNNKKETQGLLRELLTHTEMEMLSKRIQIARHLLVGESYRVIKQQVGAQNTTIAKINNLLHTSKEGWLARLTQRLIDLEAPTKNRGEKKKKAATEPDLPFTFGASQLQ